MGTTRNAYEVKANQQERSDTHQATVHLGSTSPRQPPVKSNAVVKYSAVTAPATFATLRSNTDIKLPPSNWLASYADSYGLNYSLPRTTGFTSFRMANMFPDCVGGVDVVSDAENIKKLLKIPYSDNTVSMMVHRIENTLLIDEFDIHKHLLSRAETDWAWLRKFFVEHIIETLSSKDKSLSIRDKSRYALQQKSLVSKFLHYSLAETEKDVEINDPPLNTFPLPITRGPALPEPLLEEGLPDSTNNHKFTRNVVWTFEDIQMLLGTDMPIFGGPTRPCISLRLRDATKPISVLTGIDYWLDNLMSNVPEVVMCYHLDGIVQKYELVKTEDLPHLAESKFSPKLIRDVAQNILSFLKSNATKAGHTYWLFKGTNDDAVKLYDLTSLCSDSLEEKDQNPFTVPVGMLLYRVARNMKASGDLGQLATIRILLKNCLSLLAKEKYPQIVTSAHFMLSDVYVPCETDPSAPELLLLPQSGDEGFSTKETDEDEEEEDVSGITSSLPVTDLYVTNYSNAGNKYQPPPMVSGLEERCNLALLHVSEGLDCLQYFDLKSDYLNRDKSKFEEKEPKMAKPSEAIPMPYSKLDQGKEKGKKKKKNSDKEDSVDQDDEEEDNGEDNSLKTLLCRPTRETLPTWQKPEKVDNNSWKVHLGSLLTRKACLVYSILVEREIDVGKYSLALKHIQGVLRCCDENKGLVGLMLNRAGDCLFNIANPGKSELETEDDRYPVVERPAQSLYEKELELIPNSFEDPEQLLIASIKCYTRSLELRHSVDTMRKTGNACNVLNTLYTNCAAGLIQCTDGQFKEAQFNKYIKDAEQLLELGLKNFEAVGDKSNCALLMCNMGKLNRLKAHAPSGSETNHLTPQQKHYYNKALESYTAALNYLGSRKTHPHIWEAVNWELSSMLYIYATITQDNPPPIDEKTCGDVEREAIELLQRALKHCDTTTNSPNQPLYQYRAAKLHHRLASLYYNSYRYYNWDASKKRALLHLIDSHYSSASTLFAILENPIDMLRVQLEKISLEEFIAEENKSPKLKKKHYLKALQLSVKCKDALLIIQEREPVNSEKNESENNQEDLDKAENGDREEEQSLMKLLLQRVQFFLKTLVKLISGEKQPTNVDKYKKVYGASLKKESSQMVVSHLCNVFDLIVKEDL